MRRAVMMRRTAGYGKLWHRSWAGLPEAEAEEKYLAELRSKDSSQPPLPEGVFPRPLSLGDHLLHDRM